MSEKPSTCAKCAAPLEQPATGRPRTFCGDGCRAAAAYELKRLQRRLQYLENRNSSLKQEPDAGNKDWFGRTRAEQLEALAMQIAEAEGRLRVLLTSANGVIREASL